MKRSFNATSKYDKPSECPICCDEEAELVELAPCNHWSCNDCIINSGKEICPFCRVDLVLSKRVKKAVNKKAKAIRRENEADSSRQIYELLRSFDMDYDSDNDEIQAPVRRPLRSLQISRRRATLSSFSSTSSSYVDIVGENNVVTRILQIPDYVRRSRNGDLILVRGYQREIVLGSINNSSSINENTNSIVNQAQNVEQSNHHNDEVDEVAEQHEEQSDNFESSISIPMNQQQAPINKPYIPILPPMNLHISSTPVVINDNDGFNQFFEANFNNNSDNQDSIFDEIGVNCTFSEFVESNNQDEQTVDLNVININNREVICID